MNGLLCVFLASFLGTRVKIVQYNVGAFSKEVSNSIPMVAAMVKELDADAVCLQEVDSCNLRHWRNQLKEFSKEMGGWNSCFGRAMHFLGGSYGVGVAVPDPILESFNIALPKGAGSEPRACCVVETANYVLASTHLDYKSAEAAKEQVRVLTAAIMERYGRSIKPVFLAGDMNATPGSSVLKELYLDWEPISPKSNTFPAKAPRSCIDFILALKNGAEWEVVDSGVPDKFKSGDVKVASDHLPVYVELMCRPIYSNPVLPLNCADPTVIDDRTRSGWFYLYSTQTSFESAVKRNSSPVDARAKVVNLPIYRSRNLVDWEFVGDGFPDGRPSWAAKSSLWAPDINYFDGKYVLYYALGIWGGVVNSGSGVAVSDSPEGPFADKGKLVDFGTSGVVNSIDPNYFDDGGKKYLYWGSLGGGIHGVRLSDDGLSVRKGAKSKSLSARNMEAAYMHKRGGWYYLFASAGSCCEGGNSTYRIVVGRSKSPLGPFVGPDGQSFKSMSYDYAIMDASADRAFVGPGHNAEIITDDAGTDWMLYHCYDASNGYEGRQLHLDRVLWTKDGWPYFEGSCPSALSRGPEFN